MLVQCNNKKTCALAQVFCYLAPAALTLAVKRDFLREAVLSLITPRLAALSIALYASGKSSFAFLASPATTALFTSLTTSLITLLRRMLKICFFFDWRLAFSAPLVIGI